MLGPWVKCAMEGVRTALRLRGNHGYDRSRCYNHATSTKCGAVPLRDETHAGPLGIHVTQHCAPDARSTQGPVV